MKTRYFTVAVLLTAALVLWRPGSERLAWDPVIPPAMHCHARAPAELEQGFIFTGGLTEKVHAPALTLLPGGERMAVWYGGSREGAADVALYAAWRGAGDPAWSAPRRILDRQRVARDLGRYVRKLGNAVAIADETGRVWLFFVSASLGGWSTSAINLAISTDRGRSWGRVRRLVSSPFLNLSTLVKGRPFFYADGSIGLPVYHELAGKFGELLRLDREGRVLDKARLTHGRAAIQPDIAVLPGGHLLALLRSTGPARRIVAVESGDGGRSWDEPRLTSLPNPDAAIALTGDGERLVLAYNDSPRDRNRLALAFSPDGGRNWRRVATIEADSDAAAEYSYPFLQRDAAGDFHLVYTWQRRRIAYRRFNWDWLEAVR